MKVRDQFVLRTIAGEPLLIPVGEAAITTKGLIALSQSGALLYEKLKNDCTQEKLVDALLEEYDVSRQEATQDVEDFLNQMREMDMLLEE